MLNQLLKQQLPSAFQMIIEFCLTKWADIFANVNLNDITTFWAGNINTLLFDLLFSFLYNSFFQITFKAPHIAGF